MLSRNRKHIPHSQRMEFAKQRILLVRVHLVDGEKERLPSARQESRQLAIGPCELGASIADHNDGLHFFECFPVLTKPLPLIQILFLTYCPAPLTHHHLSPTPSPPP